MKKLYTLLLLSTLVCFVAAMTRPAPHPQGKVDAKYGGVKTCKTCHLSAKSGAQFKIWKKSPHANAYATLQTDDAKKIGKENGVDDPATSGKCLQCHVVAYGVDASLKGPKLKLEEGVSCEACHGPGSLYKKKKIMKGITAGEIDGAKYGLVKVGEETCAKCHNKKSPTFKAFDYKKQLAKIAHPIPKK